MKRERMPKLWGWQDPAWQGEGSLKGAWGPLPGGGQKVGRCPWPRWGCIPKAEGRGSSVIAAQKVVGALGG